MPRQAPASDPHPDRARTPAPPPDAGQTKVAQDGASAPRLPHERDQSADSQSTPDGEPTRVGRQAHKDVARGLVDTGRGPVMDRLRDKLRR